MNAMASVVGRYRTAFGPDGEPPAHITVRGLSKQFQGDVIYDSFNLDIPRGRFTSIFGPTVTDFIQDYGPRMEAVAADPAATTP